MKLQPDTLLIRRHMPLGEMVLAATPRGAAGAWFVGQKHAPDWSTGTFLKEIGTMSADSGYSLLLKLEHWLMAYHQGQGAELPTLDLGAGTPFQQAVWRALLLIPFGQTWSYGQLAERLGNSNGVRAVAAAVGRNPLSIVVPCHRVIGANGSLTGYAGGLERKRALLLSESRVLFA